MKALYTIRLLLAPVLTAGCLLFFTSLNAAPAAGTFSPQNDKVALAGNGDKGDKNAKGDKTKKADEGAKARKANEEKIIKPQKRKRVKPMRTNHGPKKPIFPQLHRKEESLNRANHRDPYAHYRN